MNVERVRFHSPTHGAMEVADVVRRIAEAAWAFPKQPAKILVGSDSEARDTTVITTVVVFQRVGHGAVYFYTRSPHKTYASLRDRIFAEAMNSITLGQELRTRLREALGDTELAEADMEIHADIGENGPTRELVHSVVGMLRGFDFIPVIKPRAFAASIVADRHT